MQDSRSVFWRLRYFNSRGLLVNIVVAAPTERVHTADSLYTGHATGLRSFDLRMLCVRTHKLMREHGLL